MKEATVRKEGDTLIAELTCEIDHHTAKTVREAVDEALFSMRPRSLVLDFSGVAFMDSSGIGLIIGRVDKAESVGAAVRIRGLCRALSKVVRLSGIEKIKNLTIEP